jgi:nitrogenase molybdenum-iron protein beta chain
VEIQIAVATDYFGKSDLPQNEKSQALSKLAKEVYFTQDGKEINDILTHSDVELILGSSLENQAAEKKGIVNLEISYPIYNKTITNKSYAGVDGALTLLEDYLTAVKKSNALKEEKLDLYIRGEKREVS